MVGLPPLSVAISVNHRTLNCYYSLHPSLLLLPCAEEAPFDAPSFTAEAVAASGRKAAPLLSQLLQTLGFFAFLEEHAGAENPYAWYQQGCDAYRWDGGEGQTTPGGGPASARRAGDLPSPFAPSPPGPAGLMRTASGLGRLPSGLGRSPSGLARTSSGFARNSSGLEPEPPVLAHFVPRYKGGLLKVASGQPPVYRSFPCLNVAEEAKGGDLRSLLAGHAAGGAARRRRALMRSSKSIGRSLSGDLVSPAAVAVVAAASG